MRLTVMCLKMDYLKRLDFQFVSCVRRRNCLSVQRTALRNSKMANFEQAQLL